MSLPRVVIKRRNARIFWPTRSRCRKQFAMTIADVEAASRPAADCESYRDRGLPCRLFLQLSRGYAYLGLFCHQHSTTASVACSVIAFKGGRTIVPQRFVSRKYFEIFHRDNMQKIYSALSLIYKWVPMNFQRLVNF